MGKPSVELAFGINLKQYANAETIAHQNMKVQPDTPLC